MAVDEAGSRKVRGPGSPQVPGRTAALLLVTLAVVHVLNLGAKGDVPLWLWILAGATLLVSVPVALTLWRSRGLECRVYAALLAFGSGLTHLLAVTVGPPGQAPSGWTAEGAVVLGLATAVLALLARETLLRVHAERAVDLYA